ncbi:MULTISPECIES: 3' terminal RNA ribose 2'-O-methyltransferase Hen1 [unclassified Kitasatospora]|uniref:3' terminal RNA ribose 2'-O-methyltransferase Hen1 n=1 Tax=unclassified Kitasatospora TaxID=2633591 RepID=UPI000708D36F|nr:MULTISPECIES: 3' terminal RNA ribose 2'-O-methyltransferase Hen1 [unclassified Kitasatospora]KQV05424.1 3' terminal RNA ribose 2'-O-methyltransferase Hen1 [Kitasatospora sp. Root107]KRB62230.1 3' terminal RNA ribose 2'-O-methyltransferase Hen1 [Kitasatospora sp. Root187]
MFISISTTGTAERPASDLGFLLHKHPDKVQRFSTSHGEAHVFYPETGTESCTAAMLLDIDPIALVRKGRGKGRGGSPDFALAQYVNDRPYAASSLLAVALRTVFRTAMKGVCEQRPGLAEQPRPFRIALPAVPANGAGEEGGPAMVRRLFEPLGWQVEATAIPLDETFPEWGNSRYARVELSAEIRLADALQQLYVLLPVLDGAKHYWVAPDEVDKLLAAGEGWLGTHPELALITRRYLARRWSLTRTALERLELARLAEADDREAEEVDNAVDDTLEPNDTTEPNGATEPDGTPESNSGPGQRPDPTVAQESKPVSLGVLRREAILAALAEVGAVRVLDLGCGQGELVEALLKDIRVTEVLGVDVSSRALTAAARKLRLDRMSERQAARVRLVQGALTYTDDRLKGYDAAVLSEVIEHLDLPRLPALEYVVFGSARPGAVVVTTPNVEYNVRWETLPAGHVRHSDHRFEWTRAEFLAWAERIAADYGYSVTVRPVGPLDEQVGAPTQLALFRRTSEAGSEAGSTAAATATATTVTTEGSAAR